jgi:divalent metal cation (Fe/Co/Zn/Cd) transporter
MDEQRRNYAVATLWGMGPPTLTATGARERSRLLGWALYLSIASVCVGVLVGALSLTVGVTEHSVAVLGSGLVMLADLAGSVVLIWRFHAERTHPVRAGDVERRAAGVIVVALALVSAAVGAEAIRALAQQEHPDGSALSLLVAGIAVVILSPLALGKRQTAVGLGSHALRGDSSLTAIGAGTALLALIGLALFHAFGWWWADPVVALLIATIAASESYAVHREARAQRVS